MDPGLKRLPPPGRRLIASPAAGGAQASVGFALGPSGGTARRTGGTLARPPWVLWSLQEMALEPLVPVLKGPLRIHMLEVPRGSKATGVVSPSKVLDMRIMRGLRLTFSTGL